MEMTTNKQVLDFVNSRAKLVGAGKIVWITGEKEQYDQLTKEAIDNSAPRLDCTCAVSFLMR